MGELSKKFIKKISFLEKKLKINFKDKELAAKALLHPSYSHKHSISFSYERLEFLGDAVLNLVVAAELFQRHPHFSEGELTKLKAGIVRDETLSRVGEKLGLDKVIIRADELDFSGEAKSSILAEVLEALIGAIYIDQGLDSAERVILENFKPYLEDEAFVSDFKSELQEISQSRFSYTPVYRIVEESGPMHARKFRAQVIIRGKVFGEGVGESKKKAEQSAAQEALLKIREEVM
jgi:ribonuclease-3